MLDMGKLESGEIQFEDKPFDLREIIREVTVVIEKLSSEQGIELIQEEFEVKHWNLVGSQRHVKRLLMNIMSNAVKYNKQGGTITFESEEGIGTTFVITIPFKIDKTVKEDELIIDDSDEGSIDGYNILLVEDNELNMEISGFIIEMEGASYKKAWNGQEAVETFGKSSPGEFDAILMDIMMPVMDGYEASRQIRSMNREDAKTIPIIAMTANAFTDDRIKAREAGMNEHISKPIDSGVLVRELVKLVKNNNA